MFVNDHVQRALWFGWLLLTILKFPSGRTCFNSITHALNESQSSNIQLRDNLFSAYNVKLNNHSPQNATLI